MANARAVALKGQFIVDMHTNFLRDDTRLEGFVRSREAVGRVGWNPALAGKSQTPFRRTCPEHFAEPCLCAAMMGRLIKGLGVDHVVWGSDAIWTGAPQMQIDALRRLEMPEEVQRKFGFAPPGMADGPVKTAIFGHSARQ